MGEINKSKVSVVTGAASGIGASLTRQLTERGHFVLGVDINRSELDKLSEETGCSGMVGDLSSEKFNQEVASQVQNLFGKVDSVFLNAGILGRDIELQGTDFTTNELDRERYVKARSINFDAVVYGTLAMAPQLVNSGGGSIIVTASVAGITAWNRDPFYTATKHAAIGWVRGIAPALSSQGVSINAICPGGVATPLVGLDRLESKNPNLLNPEDVANAMLETVEEEGTGKAYIVEAGQEPMRQLYKFTPIEGFPV